MEARYSAGLVMMGADVPAFPTKAAAIKAAKEAARSQPGKLARFYGETWKRGEIGSRIEERFFRVDNSGRVREMPR